MESETQDNLVDTALNTRTSEPQAKVAFEGDYKTVEIINPATLRELDAIRTNVSRVLRMVEVLSMKVQKKAAQEEAEYNKQILFSRIDIEDEEKAAEPLKLSGARDFADYFRPLESESEGPINLDSWRNRHIFD